MSSAWPFLLLIKCATFESLPFWRLEVNFRLLPKQATPLEEIGSRSDLSFYKLKNWLFDSI
jgi:hypothetical protein